MIASFISLAKTFALPFSACANFIGSSTDILKLYNYIMKYPHIYCEVGVGSGTPKGAMYKDPGASQAPSLGGTLLTMHLGQRCSQLGFGSENFARIN